MTKLLKMSEIPKIPLSKANHILLRLPLKSVLRFRCVSKSFCAQIDNPNFIKQFLNHSLKTNKDFDIIMSKGPFLYSLKFPNDHDLKTAEAIEIDYPFKDSSYEVSILGSCNGVLALQKSRYYILWNKATGKYRKVEAPINCYGNQSTYFGHDQSKDDYKLVRISRNKNSYDIIVYSLKTDSWKKMNQEFPYRTCWLQSGAFLHGCVHWLVSEKPCDGFVEPELIVTFDIGNETFSQISKPHRNGHDCFMMGLYDLGGHLCLVSSELENHENPFRCYMWVMENYGVEEWTSLLPVETKEFGFRPFAYHPKGSKHILGMLGNKLACHFPERSRLKSVSVRGLPGCDRLVADSDSDLSDSYSDVSDSDDNYWDYYIIFTGCICFESLIPVQRQENLDHI